MIKFVPESAELSNPIWGPYLRMLATELTRERMRAALIARLVGISPREASAMYRAVHDSSPPSGLIPQATASFYTTGRDSRDASAPQRNLHSTLFLVVWRRLRLAVGEPRPHRGWLLLQAYRAYTVHADHYLDRDAALDINRCYVLSNMSSDHAPEMAEVALANCPKCHAPYLIETAKEQATQHCPLCRLTMEHQRLASQSTDAARKRWAGRIGD